MRSLGGIAFVILLIIYALFFEPRITSNQPPGCEGGPGHPAGGVVYSCDYQP